VLVLSDFVAKQELDGSTLEVPIPVPDHRFGRFVFETIQKLSRTEPNKKTGKQKPFVLKCVVKKIRP